MHIQSMESAKAKELKRYFTGEPCRNGHVSERYIANERCVECTSVKNAKQYPKNPQKRKDSTARWKALNPARNKHLNRRWRGLPDPTRPEPQECENCGGTPNGHGGLHLDHDHKTGAFRGWLCHSCNAGIGQLGDTIEGLERAVAYLRRAQ